MPHRECVGSKHVQRREAGGERASKVVDDAIGPKEGVYPALRRAPLTLLTGAGRASHTALGPNTSYSPVVNALSCR